MLEYDEWVVPGEVEYAEKKAAEIEAQIEKYHENFSVDKWGSYLESIYIQLTEHIRGIFEVQMLNSLWSLPDIDVYNYMNVDWFRDQVALIDEPKIFDLPDDDIRNNLPEWDESLLPDDSWRDIVGRHSARHMIAEKIEDMDGDYYDIKEEFHFSDAKCDRVMETLVKKLHTRNIPVGFTDLEGKIVDYLKNYIYDWDYHYCGSYYELWHFPLEMTENDINDAIHTAYLNASKRSRRIFPDEFDYANMDVGYLKNYECLYQGKAGDMLIRFLFDFKNMKIVMAYPVLKERISNKGNYYDKRNKCFYGR